MDFHNRSLPQVRCAAKPGLWVRAASSELLDQISCKTMLLARNPRAASKLGCCPARHYCAVPLRVEVCVPTTSVTDTVALLAPVVWVVSGRNCTVTTQAAPGARVVWPALWPLPVGPQVDNKRTMLNSVRLG